MLSPFSTIINITMWCIKWTAPCTFVICVIKLHAVSFIRMYTLLYSLNLISVIILIFVMKIEYISDIGVILFAVVFVNKVIRSRVTQNVFSYFSLHWARYCWRWWKCWHCCCSYWRCSYSCCHNNFTSLIVAAHLC